MIEQQIANEYVSLCLASLKIKEIQMKTLRCFCGYFFLIMLAMI